MNHRSIATLVIKVIGVLHLHQTYLENVSVFRMLRRQVSKYELRVIRYSSIVV